MAHEMCPQCAGGQSGELSLMKFRDGYAVVSKCLRAKCGFFRRTIDVDAEIEERGFIPRPYHKETHRLSDAGKARFVDRYGFAPRAHWVKSTNDPDAFYMPVYDTFGRLRGGTVRSFGGGPKSVAYRVSDGPWMAWYGLSLHGYPNDLVVVEDQISAMKLAVRGFKAAALLGTSLTRDRLSELQYEAGTTHKVMLALDLDAFQKAVKAAAKYPWITPVYLERDIKDMTYDEIEEKLL